MSQQNKYTKLEICQIVIILIAILSTVFFVGMGAASADEATDLERQGQIERAEYFVKDGSKQWTMGIQILIILMVIVGVLEILKKVFNGNNINERT